MGPAKNTTENPSRIEPVRLESIPPKIADAVSELSAKSAVLSASLHPKTAASLANLLRIMNCYYSNLIEGHNTKPLDIERALTEDIDSDQDRRNLQLEARAHIRVQTEIDKRAAAETLDEPTSPDFIRWLHQEFYHDASDEMLSIGDGDKRFQMQPGLWRSESGQEVVVGRHVPPSGAVIENFMEYFHRSYALKGLGSAAGILAIPAAHHRLNYIHPFHDGNGRVSRLMSHAMTLKVGIGAHGLWSISRGLARGIKSRSEYKQMMDHADMPRQGDLDGRGNLSLKALEEFTLWFLEICLDQVQFMSELFEFDRLRKRLESYVATSESLKPEALFLLHETFIRGEIERGEASRITSLPERSARRVLNDIVDHGLLASDTPKGPVSLRFPTTALDALFPQLFTHA